MTLFLTAFGAATLLPGGSEALLLYYQSEGLNPFYLLISASVGNTLGSVLNFFLGLYAYEWAMKKNYINPLHVEKSKKYFDKYGSFALLLSWTPIIGDALTFVAGILRYNFLKFLLLVGIAKTLRYGFLIFIYANFNLFS